MHKPSPEPFKEIVQRLQVLPKECIMVGDWPGLDVVGASKVGMKTAFANMVILLEPFTLEQISI